MTANSSSVLLLGWDHTSEALPFAHTLPQPAGSQLWLAEPLAAGDAPDGLTVQLLGRKVPEGFAPQDLGQAEPAAPYVGRDASSRVSFTGSASTMRIPAAPYAGAASETTEFVGASQAPATPDAAATGIVESGAPADAVVLAEFISAAPGAPPRRLISEPGPAEAATLIGAASLLPVFEPAPEPLIDAAVATESAAPAVPAAAPLADVNANPAPQPTSAGFPPIENPAVPEAHALLDAVEENEAGLNFRIIQYARHAARLAHGTAFDVIFAPDWPSWLAGVEIRHMTRRPLVLHVKELAADRPTTDARGWGEALERLTLPHADRILVSNPEMAERLCGLYPIPAHRVHVLGPDSAPDLTAALVLETRLPV